MCVFWELLLSLIIITVRFLDDSSMCYVCFPHEEVGKESAYNAGDLGSIFRLGRLPCRREWLHITVFLTG